MSQLEPGEIVEQRNFSPNVISKRKFQFRRERSDVLDLDSAIRRTLTWLPSWSETRIRDECRAAELCCCRKIFLVGWDKRQLSRAGPP